VKNSLQQEEECTPLFHFSFACHSFLDFLVSESLEQAEWSAIQGELEEYFQIDIVCCGRVFEVTGIITPRLYQEKSNDKLMMSITKFKIKKAK